MSSNQPDQDESVEQRLPTLVDDDEDDGLSELLESAPPELRGRIVQVIQQQVSHTGWLPPPEQLAAYEQVLPGLAERIVRLPEREQEHRHTYLNKQGERDYRLKARGQSFALTAMSLLLAFSVFLALEGSLELAAGVAIATIVGVVGIFVTGKVADRRASDEQSESE